MRYIKFASLIILLALVIKFAGAVGMALEAGKAYVELRALGSTHELALCELGEWSDNMARYFGMPNADDIQSLYFGYWCGNLASELSENTPIVPECPVGTIPFGTEGCIFKRNLA